MQVPAVHNDEVRGPRLYAIHKLYICLNIIIILYACTTLSFVVYVYSHPFGRDFLQSTWTIIMLLFGICLMTTGVLGVRGATVIALRDLRLAQCYPREGSQRVDLESVNGGLSNYGSSEISAHRQSCSRYSSSHTFNALVFICCLRRRRVVSTQDHNISMRNSSSLDPRSEVGGWKSRIRNNDRQINELHHNVNHDPTNRPFVPSKSRHTQISRRVSVFDLSSSNSQLVSFNGGAGNNVRGSRRDVSNLTHSHSLSDLTMSRHSLDGPDNGYRQNSMPLSTIDECSSIETISLTYQNSIQESFSNVDDWQEDEKWFYEIPYRRGDWTSVVHLGFLFLTAIALFSCLVYASLRMHWNDVVIHNPSFVSYTDIQMVSGTLPSTSVFILPGSVNTFTFPRDKSLWGNHYTSVTDAYDESLSGFFDLFHEGECVGGGLQKINVPNNNTSYIYLEKDQMEFEWVDCARDGADFYITHFITRPQNEVELMGLQNCIDSVRNTLRQMEDHMDHMSDDHIFDMKSTWCRTNGKLFAGLRIFRVLSLTLSWILLAILTTTVVVRLKSV